MKPAYSYLPAYTSHQYQPSSLPSYPTFAAYSNANTSHLEQIEGQSHIEYIPYERTVIEYQQIEEIEMVPYERKIIEYEQRKRIQRVPVQKTYTDYYTIEHLTEYIPHMVPETHVQYVPVQKTENKLYYYPIERSKSNNQDSIFQERMILEDSTVFQMSIDIKILELQYKKQTFHLKDIQPIANIHHIQFITLIYTKQQKEVGQHRVTMTTEGYQRKRNMLSIKVDKTKSNRQEDDGFMILLKKKLSYSQQKKVNFQLSPAMIGLFLPVILLSIKTRAKSKLEDASYLNPYRQTLKRSSLSPGPPINIFISMDKLSKESKRASYDTIDQVGKRRLGGSKSRLYTQQASNLHTITSTSRRFKQQRTNSQSKHRSIDHLHYYSLKHDNSKQKKNSIQLKLKANKRQEQYIAQEQSSNQLDGQEDRLVYEQLKHDNDRFPNGFKKFKLVGRGGFSLVWLGYHIKTKTSYAVKQILTRNKYQTHLKQIWFCTYFFKNGKPRRQFQRHPGADNLLMMFDYEIGQLDTWIVYQMCDGSLGSMLYNIFKSQAPHSEDYTMKYKGLYMKMRQSTQFLRHLIIEIAKALDLLEMNNIVHSDIKTQNILLKQNGSEPWNYQFKLIDYGSSFSFTNLKQYTLATPQYMCPQLLNYILYQNGQSYDKQMLQTLRNYQNVSAIDVWGFGCVILEIINGVPLWVSNPTKIEQNGKQIKVKGLFASDKNSNRSFNKIIEKQMELLKDIDTLIKQKNYSQIKLDDDIIKVLKRMLEIDPSKRIKPRQIAKILGAEIICPKFSLLDL